MAIIRWQTPGGPFDELERLRREMDRVFNDFSAGGEPFFSRAYPAVNITEDTENYYVRGELPGIKSQDLDVSVVEGRLIIRGEQKLATEDKAASYHRREREGGFFRRIIALPVRVAPDKVSATIKNGVFTISLPKAEETKPRKITVKSL
jgi:HSP20 family protein